MSRKEKAIRAEVEHFSREVIAQLDEYRDSLRREIRNLEPKPGSEVFASSYRTRLLQVLLDLKLAGSYTSSHEGESRAVVTYDYPELLYSFLEDVHIGRGGHPFKEFSPLLKNMAKDLLTQGKEVAGGEASSVKLLQ